MFENFNFENYQYVEVAQDELKTHLCELYNSCQFKVLIDCFAACINNQKTVYYQLSNYQLNIFIFTKLNTDKVDSIIDIFPNANWYEREIFEKFGINFIGHYDLKPLML